VNNSRRTVVIIVTGAAVVALAGVLLLWARGRQPQPPAGIEQPRTAAQIHQPVITHVEQGQMAWRLQLREVKIGSGGQTLTALGVREGLIYGAEGKPVVRVTADRVAGDTATRDFEVTGNVGVVTSDGAIFSTDKVRWLQEEEKLECPGAVTMRDKQATVSTTGLEFYVSQNLVKCPNFINMMNGDNRLVGRNLRYDVKSADFEMEKVQAVFNVEEARAIARGER